MMYPVKLSEDAIANQIVGEEKRRNWELEQRGCSGRCLCLMISIWRQPPAEERVSVLTGRCNMVIFICKDDFDSILCGVYDAWMSRLGHDNVRLQLQGAYNMELFAKYRDVQVTEEKVDKVIQAVVQKISRGSVWLDLQGVSQL